MHSSYSFMIVFNFLLSFFIYIFFLSDLIRALANDSISLIICYIWFVYPHPGTLYKLCFSMLLYFLAISKIKLWAIVCSTLMVSYLFLDLIVLIDRGVLFIMRWEG